MTHLRQTMLEELQRRNYAPTTVQAYIHAVEQFAKHFHRPPDQLASDHLREYQAYLLRDRKLEPRTVKLHVAALRFFFVKTLKRRYLLDDIPVSEGPAPAADDPDRRGSHAIDRRRPHAHPPHDADGAVFHGDAERGDAEPAGAATSTAGRC